jgi:D-glucosaminate-6-phosphate ammonia-lyase
VSYDPYAALGVRPIINARGHQTVLGGSTPSPRVRQAMEAAERYYVEMPELLARSGEIISHLLECEAAYITSGAFAALVLGTAACITGNDVDKMGQLPNTTGLKNKVLLQVGHHYHYERAPTIVGGHVVEVGEDRLTTNAQLEAALTDDVAAVLFPAHLDGAPGTLSLSKVVETAHRHGVPVLVDAAGRVYPLDLMKSYTRQGADLVAFGAKYVGGPNSSGILCGRRELVEAAVPQGFAGYESVAYGKSFGRPFKLDRQEVVAVVVALQEWFAMDHEARLARLQQRLDTIASALAGAPGVSTRVLEGNGPAPRLLELTLAPGEARHDVDSLVRELHDGEPSIVVMTDNSAILVNPVTVLDGDEVAIGRRLAELLR